MVMNKVKQIGLMLIAFILSSSILCNVVSADEFYPKDYNAYKIQYPENVYSIDYCNNVALEFILLPDSNARSTTSKTGYGRFYLVDSSEDLAKFSLKSAFWYDGERVYIYGNPITTCESLVDGFAILAEAPKLGTTGVSAFASCVFELEENGMYNNGATITIYCTIDGDTRVVVA